MGKLVDRECDQQGDDAGDQDRYGEVK